MGRRLINIMKKNQDSSLVKPNFQPVNILTIIISAVVALVVGFGGAAAYNFYANNFANSKIGSNQNKNVVVSEQNATIQIAKKVSPSVVSITTSTSSQDLFGRSTQLQGAGTGIIISENGLILTNKHVAQSGGEFTVVASNGKQYNNAKLVATDPTNDIAFIKIDANGLTPAELGDSSKMETGSFVVAIGNALGQFQNTVTTGVISGKGRPVTAADGNSTESLQNLFQTDAAINPGNSGGPLVNIEGQVIGINTAVAGQGSENIGFAIPINEAKKDIDLVSKGQEITKAYLGVKYVMLTPQIAKSNNLDVDKGAYIAQSGIVPSSPAEKAGLSAGDVILKVNDTEINEDNNLTSVISQYNPGETVTITFIHNGKTQSAKVELAKAPQ